MGTPEFAIPSLAMLAASDNNILGVVTQPDRPRGRGKKLHPPPIKTLAQQHGLSVIQPVGVKEENFIKSLKGQNPDLIVVVAFGQILPPKILRIPHHGCINLHASLLPAHRGAAPINWALIKGEETTGVTTIFINEWMDTGDILLKKEIEIEKTDDALSLSHRLSTLGAKLLLETIRQLKKGDLSSTPQDHSKASYAPALKKEDGNIEWKMEAQAIHNQIRGTVPWPGTATNLDNKLLKILKSKVIEEENQEPPGKISQVSPEGIKVATGKSYLLLTEVQLQDRKRMKAAEFVRGHPIPIGTMLI
ncbi:MAG: methionyl-tRNA formyltransferase [Deltaproteobacteria bacterium]|jgi:methionyl-tRNA formyltransferase|nr:methionyl-tRNA formyltransferase [Deltaproteobacteria bacterium]